MLADATGRGGTRLALVLSRVSLAMSDPRRFRRLVGLWGAVLAFALATDSASAGRTQASPRARARPARKADPSHWHAMARRMVPTRRPRRTSLSHAEARQFFDALAGSRLGFDYPDSGCEARADVAAAAAERAGVRAHKVLVYSDGEVPLRAATRNTVDGTITWDYHIALAIEVDGALRVFDPALFDRPGSVRTWKKRVGAEHAGVKVLPGNQYMDDFDPAPREVRIRQLAGSLSGVARLRRKARARQAELERAGAGE